MANSQSNPVFRTYAALGSLNSFLCIAIGAFGAHALKPVLGAQQSVFETGVQYHMMHALGLFVVAFLADRTGSSKSVVWAGRLMQLGIILFSGSLYAIGITHVSILGAITPLGGVSFLLSWFLLGRAVWNAAGIK